MVQAVLQSQRSGRMKGRGRLLTPQHLFVFSAENCDKTPIRLYCCARGPPFWNFFLLHLFPINKLCRYVLHHFLHVSCLAQIPLFTASLSAPHFFRIFTSLQTLLLPALFVLISILCFPHFNTNNECISCIKQAEQVFFFFCIQFSFLHLSFPPALIFPFI